MRRPKLLDLYCCQGGASAGYEVAGFDVYGVDIDPQPRYPYPFVQQDALVVLAGLLGGRSITLGDEVLYLHDFAAVHGSPPCQGSSKTQRIWDREWPKLIAPTRELILETGLPYVIENVMDAEAELIRPTMLCGAMFALRTYRHRLFEANWDLTPPEHPEHVAKNTKMGRAIQPGEFMHVVGNFSGVDLARDVMGAPWMNRDGLRESIPPAYAEHVGTQLLHHLSIGA